MFDDFLPICKKDLEKRGWQGLDVILVTGDAYVDHPSYGVSVVARVLENAGFRVGIIAQPDWRSKDDFMCLGRPRLFFGVTSGNVDSMIANYTANKRIRSDDDYSPGQKSGFRPDRSLIIYSNRIKQAFPNAKIVLGGIEASLRRFSHYDYWDDKVRRSVLMDAKADMLIYGMGERQIVEIARRLNRDEQIENLNDIRGTVVVRKSIDFLKSYTEIPSFEEVYQDKNKFNLAFKLIYENQNPFSAKPLVQKHADRYVVCFSPVLPLKTQELDRIFELSYVRNWHPIYNEAGGIRAFETVRNSIISHRGCAGECSFCSLYFHQGRIVQSRSVESILKEAKIISQNKDFKGTIADIGGPTANLYKANCAFWEKQGACANQHCLTPKKCSNLKLAFKDALSLYKKVKQLPKVKHVFVGSGFRYDLFLEDGGYDFLKELCKNYISGQMKVAPEYNSDYVLEIMNKPQFSAYEKFVQIFEKINKSLKKKCFLVNYFISSHPGSKIEDAKNLSVYLKKHHIHPEQIQDFIPLPMTLSGAIYYTGKHPITGESIYIPKTFQERKLQRSLIQST